MNATRTTELQYFIQQTAPVLLQELDRAQTLRCRAYGPVANDCSVVPLSGSVLFVPELCTVCAL